MVYRVVHSVHYLLLLYTSSSEAARQGQGRYGVRELWLFGVYSGGASVLSEVNGRMMAEAACKRQECCRCCSLSAQQ